MSNAANPKSLSKWNDRNVKCRWLLWALGIVALSAILGPTIVIPAVDRIYFAFEERQLNNAFQRDGINGRATFSGRLFEGRMYIAANNLDDSKVAPLARILKSQRSIQIVDSVLTWQGLQHLAGCQRLRYVMFVDSEVSDADLQRLQEAMPSSKVSAKWQNSDRFFPSER